MPGICPAAGAVRIGCACGADEKQVWFSRGALLRVPVAGAGKAQLYIMSTGGIIAQ